MVDEEQPLNQGCLASSTGRVEDPRDCLQGSLSVPSF